MLVGQIVYIAVTLGVWRLIYGRQFSLSTKLLKGLVYYRVEGEGSVVREEDAPRRRRDSRYARQRLLQFNAPDRILQIELTAPEISRRRYYSHYDCVVALFVVTVVHGVLSINFPFLFRHENGLVIPAAITTFALTLLTLLQTDLWAAKRMDRWDTLILFILGSTGSYAILWFKEDWLQPIELEKGLDDMSQELERDVCYDETGEELSQSMNLMHPLAAQGASEGGTPSVGAATSVMAYGVAVVAGLIACVSCQAAIRVTRSSELMLKPPQDLTVSLRCPSWFSTLHALQTVLIVGNIMLWIDPLAILQGPYLRAVQRIVPVCIAVLQCINFRPVMQGYLNQGLILWFDEIQGGAGDLGSELKRLQLVNKVTKCSLLLCRVAVQVLLLPVCLTCLSILLMKSQSQNQSSFHAVCGFLSWWSTLVWLIYSGITTALFRMGWFTV